jgi:hypothetical protein
MSIDQVIRTCDMYGCCCYSVSKGTFVTDIFCEELIMYLIHIYLYIIKTMWVCKRVSV